MFFVHQTIQDSGAYMEHRYAGPKSISILGLNKGKLELTKNGWGHRVIINMPSIVTIYSSEGNERL